MQNQPRSLQLLLAQRRMYSVAKRWQTIRWWGVLVIGVSAPVLAVFFPTTAVLVGAIAGLWLFAGRTVLAWAESDKMSRAAAVQELFDQTVFGMPRSITRSELPSPEDIARIAGAGAELTLDARREKLLDWYPIELTNSGARAVGIAQRANAAYSDRLLRATVTLWVAAAGIWVSIVIVASLIVHMDLATFLLGVFLPVLPAALDAFEYIRSIARAAKDRADLANTIAGRLEPGENIEPYELLVWQERLYDLRRTTPQVPDWLYRLLRDKNEKAMHDVAAQFASRPSSAPTETPQDRQ
ncbi:S-4TM family putative pore-forming effector [Microbacterium phosphatis]|uniref:S-4TM family putative pore-forming effector n=1 Tax=Microbacterium phosphatis TaxID=3140248 RepID=UPI0031405200